MNTTSSSARTSAQPTARPQTPTGRRRLALPELVRDLAGWTLPTHQPTTTPQPAGWPLA